MVFFKRVDRETKLKTLSDFNIILNDYCNILYFRFKESELRFQKYYREMFSSCSTVMRIFRICASMYTYPKEHSMQSHFTFVIALIR